MDEQNITDEALLQVPPAADEPISAQDLFLAAKATISQAASALPEINELELEDCTKLLKALYRGTKFSSVKRFNLPIYQYLCRLLGFSEAGVKEIIYNRLAESVCIC